MLSLQPSTANTDHSSERALYAEMISRAVRDVLRGAEPGLLEKADDKEPAALRRLENAQRALGWIFSDAGLGGEKERCGLEPCPPEPGLEEGPCRSWRPQAMCRRVTFVEACHGINPPLEPDAFRERLLGFIRANGLDLD
jgi:hypothetical protein